jgi:hypothetical protein
LQPGAIEEAVDPEDPDGINKIWVPNPLAENIKYLANEANGNDGYRYYLDKIPGMKRSQILVDFAAKWGISITGQPVYDGTYDDEYHVSATEIEPDKNLPVYIGVDFGLHPAVIFAQVTQKGQLIILKEIAPNQPSGVSLEEFIADWYRPFVLKHFAGARSFVGWGDPSGRGRSAIDKRSPFTMLNQAGILCKPAHTNNFLPRKEAVETFLLKRNGMLINPSCVWIRKGFMGGYGYPMNNGVAKLEPAKNDYSHPHDALQYLCLGVLKGDRQDRVSLSGGSNGVAY